MRAATLLYASLISAIITRPLAGQADGGLPRRPFFGAQLAPITGSADSLTPGILVRAVLPESPASKALTQGDVILAFEGEPVRSVPQFLALLRRRNPGSTIRLSLRRGESLMQRSLVLAELRREAGEGYEVSYTALGDPGRRRRVIITRPSGRTPSPAVLLIGGIGCYSLDNPLTSADPYLRILQGLTQRGFVTMRVEKAGMGDSEGDCVTQDFAAELSGYVAGARLLKSLPYVDSSRVFLLGHSIGGIADPLVAEQVSVRGIIAVATVVQPWLDYEIENSRRQLRLSGLSGDALETAVATKERCTRRLLLERRPREQILAEEPGCAAFIRYPASDRYLQQVAALELRQIWARVGATVLALYPGADFVSALHDHEEIAAIVNRVHPGWAAVEVLPETDHQLQRVSSMEKSFRIATQGAPPQPFNENTIEVIGNWLGRQG
jgi:hypothetical protein